MRQHRRAVRRGAQEQVGASAFGEGPRSLPEGPPAHRPPSVGSSHAGMEGKPSSCGHLSCLVCITCWLGYTAPCIDLRGSGVYLVCDGHIVTSHVACLVSLVLSLDRFSSFFVFFRFALGIQTRCFERGWLSEVLRWVLMSVIVSRLLSMLTFVFLVLLLVF